MGLRNTRVFDSAGERCPGASARPRTARSRRARVALAVASATVLGTTVTAALTVGNADRSAPEQTLVPPLPGDLWALAWADEFNGGVGDSPNSKKWIIEPGNKWPDGPVGWGHNELQTYTADLENVSLDGLGELRIVPTVRDGQWFSARIKTHNSGFKAPAGGALKIEGRLRLPDGGQGYFPAFWAVGDSIESGATPWPTGGEFNLMENISGSSKVQSALHCGVPRGGPCREPAGLTTQHNLGADALAMHTYTLIWEDDLRRVSFQIDGRTINSIAATDVGDEAWNAAFGNGYRLVLNVAIGGDWPGSPDSSTRAGAAMAVDYVRVFTRPAG